MKKILVSAFSNMTPHLETTIELVKDHADKNDDVTFIFAGHDTLYDEHLSYPIKNGAFVSFKTPEVKGVELVNSPNVTFIPRIHIPVRHFSSEKDIENLNCLREIYYENFDLGEAVISSLSIRLMSADIDHKEHSLLLKKMLDSGLSVYLFFKEYLASSMPDLVYIFNGTRVHERALWRAAQHHDIPVLIHERGGSADRYFLDSFPTHDFDQMQNLMLRAYSQAADRDLANKIAIEYFQNGRLGKERDWIAYTDKQKKGLLPMNLDASKRIITYFHTCDLEYAGSSKFFQWGSWDNQLHAVKDLIQACQQQKNCQLIIRLHPNLINMSQRDQKIWLDIGNQYQELVLINPESPIDSYALIDASDITVTSSSTAGIESVYWGTPCITIGPNMYSKLSCTYSASCSDQLIQYLSHPKLSAEQEKTYPFGFFVSTMGKKYKFYKPSSLWRGEFLGVNLFQYH